MQAIRPDARVVYADNDPSVLPDAEALLTSTPEGATDYLDADVRRPQALLERAARVLDFDRPIALSLLAVLHFLPDDANPYAAVRTLVKGLPPGSHLLLSHGTADQHPEWGRRIESEFEKGAIPLRLRTRSEVEPFFEGLELVSPGLVYATEWYQEGPAPLPERSAFHVGVARLPE